MKKWVLHTIMVGLWSLLLISCTQEEKGLAEDKVKVSFILSMSNTAGSRAVDIPKEEGNEYENAINLNDVQVYIYDATTGDYKDEVHNLNITQDADKKTYRITGYLPIAYSNFKIMVFANCGTVDPRNLSSLTFDYNAKNIPMWGVKTISRLGNTNTITISLLRAMAKVQVKLSDRSTGCTLESAKMTYYNKKGICLPNKFGEMAETTDVEYVTIPSGSVGSDLPFDKIDDGSCVLYLPEFRHTGEGVQYLAGIDVSVKDVNGTYHNANIKFGKYDSSGKFAKPYWDIIRNHYYIFNLLLNVDADSNLNLQVETEKYAEWALYPSYGE